MNNFLWKIIGTLSDVFSIGKDNKVSIRSNSGTIEAANSDGVYKPIFSNYSDVRHIDIDTTLDNSYSFIICDSDNLMITLPPAGDVSGLSYTIKNSINANNTVIHTQNGEIIDIYYSIPIIGSLNSINLKSDGIGWYLY